MKQDQEFAKGIEIPFEPDSVLSPSIRYGKGPAAILYNTNDDQHVRVSFEKLDALRVCRGEYLPYASDFSQPHRSCYLIDNSRWLLERHTYESTHYRGCYDFGNDVDEMLTDFDHYVLSFHDEFIEAIAAGIWFEQSATAFDLNSLGENHPLIDLSEDKTIERFEISGITCQVRSNRRTVTEILDQSRYCSQPLFHIALELDGRSSVCCRFDVRTRRESTKSIWRNSLGRVEAVLDGMVTLSQAKSLIEPYINEVREKRRQTGK